jgi:hypothetical protein
MEAVTDELALRYLLELSTDIRAALLLDSDGGLLASAPERASDRSVQQCAELAKVIGSLADSGKLPLEVDVTATGGAVFLLREEERTLVCVTGPFALPGLILHDMRVVLDDLRRGAPEDSGT